MVSESALLNLYLQIAPTALFRLLQKQAGKVVRTGIFSPRLVVWMMMNQRLQTGGSLARSLEQLHQGRFDSLLSPCKRVRQRRIGLGTGGYCQARQKLPTIVVRRSVTELIERLRQRITEDTPNGQPRMYVVDGSSLQLEYCPEMVKDYPQAEGRNRSHRLIVRLVVLHDVETALAERPYWGPMYGRKAVSEQELAQRAMEHVAAGAVLMGDRNFGIFSTAYPAHQHGHGVMVRLTKVRATALMGQPISQQGERPVEWRSSRWDRAKHPGWPADAQVVGRLIAWRVGRGKQKQWLYLFTTLDAPAERVVEWYGKRWRIETDLRSLKQTVRLSQLQVRSTDMVEKELLIAVLAYNLVRTIMHLAAQRCGGDPGQLSFTCACNIVLDGCPALLAARGEQQPQRALDRIIQLVGRCKLPKRRKARHYPRAVWSRGFRFALRKEGEN